MYASRRAAGRIPRPHSSASQRTVFPIQWKKSRLDDALYFFVLSETVRLEIFTNGMNTYFSNILHEQTLVL